MADTTSSRQTNSWSLEVTASANDTNVIFTARTFALEWVRTASTPADTASGHILEPDQDKNLILKNGEKIYTRVPQKVQKPTLVKTVT